MSTPAATWRSACSLAPTRAATGTRCFLPMSIIARGGTPSALAINRIGCRNESLEHFERALRVERLRLIGRHRCGRQFDVVRLEELAGEVAMLRRHPRLETVPGDVRLARRGDILGDQHVDAIGLAVDMVIDPFQFPFDGLGCVDGRAQHAEAAGAAHRGHHVATMAEGEQGKFDTQHLADRRFHRITPWGGVSVLRLLPWRRPGCRTLPHHRPHSQAASTHQVLRAGVSRDRR